MNITDHIAALEKEIEAKKKELIALRLAVPETPVEDYNLTKPDGSTVRLSELFGEYSQMLLIHNMGTGCSYCTLWADGFNSFWPYFKTKCAFALTSPDPVAKMAPFVAGRKWEYPVVSLDGTTLTKDFDFADSEGGTNPGVTALTKHADGTITRQAQAEFGPGDDYCAIWPLIDLLPSGQGDWEPNYHK